MHMHLVTQNLCIEIISYVQGESISQGAGPKTNYNVCTLQQSSAPSQVQASFNVHTMTLVLLYCCE